MIVYSHRLQANLQQLVLDLGLDLVLSDENSPVSLSDNEPMLRDVCASLNIDMKKLSGDNGSIFFRFQRRPQ